MPVASNHPPGDAPHVSALARIYGGELPLAAAIPELARSPAATRALDYLRSELRRLSLPPGHPLPWAAVCYGLDAPEHCARRDVARAERLVARLRRLAPTRRAFALERARASSQNPALIDALIAEARRALGNDPYDALAWLELVTCVIHRLITAGFPEPLLGPGRLRLAAHRANAYRVAGDLPEADRRFLALSTHPYRRELARLEIEAELLSLEASLRIDLRQFERAEDLLLTAADLYGRVGDRVGMARVLMQRGSVASYTGCVARAAACDRQAAELLDPTQDGALYLMCRKNLADTLIELDRPAEAAALLASARELLDQAEEPLRLRWHWVEARIARAEHRHDAAERLLLEVCEGFLAHHRPYDAALATLDLTEIDLARGDWKRVRRRAAMLAPIFEARGVHREAQAALILFQQAANAERLTTEFLGRLRRYLHFAPRDPRLRFDPAAGAVPAG